MEHFHHEQLDVYQISLAFVVFAEGEVLDGFPSGRSYLADQLRRAATSVTLNIAEGAGEFAAPDKARFYRMARRSATECAAVLDVCGRLHLIPEEKAAQGRLLLLRIVAMITALVVRRRRSGWEEVGTGSGSGSGSGSGGPGPASRF